MTLRSKYVAAVAAIVAFAFMAGSAPALAVEPPPETVDKAPVLSIRPYPAAVTIEWRVWKQDIEESLRPVWVPASEIKVDDIWHRIDGGPWMERSRITLRGFGKHRIARKVTWHYKWEADVDRAFFRPASCLVTEVRPTLDYGNEYSLDCTDSVGGIWKAAATEYDEVYEYPNAFGLAVGASYPLPNGEPRGIYEAVSPTYTTVATQSLTLRYKNNPCMTDAERKRIRLGMTRGQVADIVGGYGRVYSRNPSYFTVIWNTCESSYDTVMIGFYNNGGAFSISG